MWEKAGRNNREACDYHARRLGTKGKAALEKRDEDEQQARVRHGRRERTWVDAVSASGGLPAGPSDTGLSVRLSVSPESLLPVKSSFVRYLSRLSWGGMAPAQG